VSGPAVGGSGLGLVDRALEGVPQLLAVGEATQALQKRLARAPELAKTEQRVPQAVVALVKNTDLNSKLKIGWRQKEGLARTPAVPQTERRVAQAVVALLRFNISL
jgi:hypothetical protein